MNRPTPFETYLKYVAIKQHFTPGSSYDYFKYGGKTRTVSSDKFETRPDRYMFYKLSRRYDPGDLELFLAWNLFHNPKKYISALLNDDCHTIFLKHKKYSNATLYHFEEDLRKFEFPKDVQIKSETNSKLLHLYYTNEIFPETLIYLNSLTDLFSLYDEKLSDDILWEKERKKLERIAGFISIDRKKLVEFFENFLQMNTIYYCT